MPGLRVASIAAVALALAFGGLVIGYGGDLGKVGRFLAWWVNAYSRPHVPDLAPIMASSTAIKIHVATVLVALATGTFLMLHTKGRMVHRVVGWIWAVFMVVTAFTTLFIHVINPQGLSFIHGFSFYALLTVPLAVYFAKRHNVKSHGSNMTGIYFGALIVAGTFSFLPGRIMYAVIFG